MKRQVYNPFLPLTEYIPDGEPHVFGDRVYLYGSHDAPRSTRFCVRDYTVWSAPVDDLSDWSCHGVTYRRDQDKRARNGKLPDYYAPDCVRGNDGRYYLYYSAMGPNVPGFGPMSVAVGDTPAGPFAYLGDIRYPDGSPVLDFLTNDPAVLNDNGRIWLYYGWGLGRDFRGKLMKPIYDRVLSKLCNRSLSQIRGTEPSVLSCAVVELEDDMRTVKSTPRAVLDSKTTAPKDSPLYRHPFYEAASIRKFGALYYLVYSSGADNALCYATSNYPDHGFEYRGVIISNADLGLDGNTLPVAPAGTIHGGIECVGGRYYIFYHRLTNNTDFSRQACCEPIEIEPDGTIRQVEVTSCGLNGGPLKGEGTYPAAICCNLLLDGKKIPVGVGKGQKFPRVDQEDETAFVHDIQGGTTLGYKYFDFKDIRTLTVTHRGCPGTLEVRTAPDGPLCGGLALKAWSNWTATTAPVSIPDGVSGLYLRFIGEGKCDILDFTIGG